MVPSTVFCTRSGIPGYLWEAAIQRAVLTGLTLRYQGVLRLPSRLSRAVGLVHLILREGSSTTVLNCEMHSKAALTGSAIQWLEISFHGNLGP